MPHVAIAIGWERAELLRKALTAPLVVVDCPCVRAASRPADPPSPPGRDGLGADERRWFHWLNRCKRELWEALDMAGNRPLSSVLAGIIVARWEAVAAAVQTIAAANWPMCIASARKFSRYQRFVDEQISDAALGLMVCIDRFDACAGTRFSTWAYRGMYFRILTGVRESQDSNNGRVFLSPEISQQWVGTLAAARPDDPTPSDRAAFALRGEIDTLLPPRLAEAVRMYYGFPPWPEDMTLDDIAARLKLSRQRVSQILIKARETIAAKFKPPI